MPTKSPHFARIKSDVLKIVAAIPEGRVATYRAIGEHLDVVPRHVAYILTMLDAKEKAAYAWYRVVGDDGKLGSRKVSEHGDSQSALLLHEGLTVQGHTLINIASIEVTISRLKSGVPKQKRPPETERS
jgi:methylated-DNA-protein-cysteine methyltransferase related protein